MIILTDFKDLDNKKRSICGNLDHKQSVLKVFDLIQSDHELAQGTDNHIQTL